MNHANTAWNVSIFPGRWLRAPLHIGLVGRQRHCAGPVRQAFFTLLPQVRTLDGGQIMVGVLTWVDGALVAPLLLTIVFAGCQNFVSKITTENDEHRPEWMAHVTFFGLKAKLIASIVAISAIELRKAFVAPAATPASKSPGRSACT